MPKWLSGILGGLALFALGCRAPPAASVRTFCEPPAGWRHLDGREPQFVIRSCHLEVRGDSKFVDPTPFEGDLEAAVEVAFAGGDARGFAGLFVEDLAAAERPFFCVAVRATGELRTFRSSDPEEPLGGRGWEPVASRSPAGFLRLGASVTAGEVRFFVDGRAVGTVRLDPSGAPARAFAVGIFNRGATTRWKNFAAGESRPAAEFRPEEHGFWGGAAEAAALLERASQEAEEFAARPSRSGVYPVVASLDQALRILRGGTDAGLLRGAETRAGRIAESLLDAADSIGETPFVRAAFAGLAEASSVSVRSPGAARYLERAREAERRGARADAFCLYAAAELEGAGVEAAERAKALGSSLAPLRLEVVVKGDPPDALFDARVETSRVLRALYGSASRTGGGDLRIEIATIRSAKETETRDAERRIPVYARGGEALAALEEEAESLSRKIRDGLTEALARATILKAARRSEGGSPGGEMREAAVGGRRYEVLIDDARKLEDAERRLAELRKKIAAEETRSSVAYETIPAKLQTVSVVYEFSLSAHLDSKQLVRVAKERVYRGVEEWEHPADRRRGIPASRFRPERVREAAEAVRGAAMERIRTAVSPENLLAALPREERLSFAVRYAKAARTEEAKALLEWTIEEVLGLKGSLRRRVAAACSE